MFKLKSKILRSQNELYSEWVQYVNPPLRLKTSGPFLNNCLSELKGGLIFDGSLGLGLESIFLLKKGYDVISNEIDPVFIDFAKRNAIDEKVNLEITSFNWLDLGYLEYFSAIFILGNSLCLLDSLDEFKASLIKFMNAIKKGGKLIFDVRNFDKINIKLDSCRMSKLEYSYKVIYCGKGFYAKPTEWNGDKISMSYFHEGQSREIQSFKMLNLKLDIVKSILQELGFESIKTYYDFSPKEDKNCDFITFEITK